MLSASDHRSSSSPSSGSPSPQEPDRPGRKNHRKPRGSGRENHGDRPGRKKPWGSGVRRRKRLRDFAGGGSVVGRSRYPRPPPGGPRSEFKQAMLPHRSPSIVGKGRWVQLDRPRDRRSSSWGGVQLVDRSAARSFVVDRILFIYGLLLPPPPSNRCVLGSQRLSD